MLFCNINEAFNITKINDTSTEIIDNNSSNNSIGRFVESEIKKSIEKKDIPKEKINLTHRSCLSIYFNSDHSDEKILECALKHINKCELCKKEITKHQIKNQNKNKKLPENQKISEYQLQSDIKEDNENQYKSIIEKQQNIINNLNNKLEKIEYSDNTENNQHNPLLLVHIIIGILLVFDILVRIRR